MDVFTFVTHVSAFMSQRTTLGKYLALPRTDFLYQLTRSCCLSVFICLCLLVLSRSPSPLLLTSHLYPLKQTRCKGSQHCCANEKNAGFTLGFQHHICLNTVTLVNCNVMGDYVPLLSLSTVSLLAFFVYTQHSVGRWDFLTVVSLHCQKHFVCLFALHLFHLYSE